ncbi:MAG: alpha-glucosidase [Bacteroidota bacterium]
MSKVWWKEGIVYQIYPRSFYDSNNDGVGDIKGIIEKLDYIKSLGVDIIWLCPVYKSPNDDNGYDISDYYGIMDEFGTMDDFDELLSEMKKRKLRLVMDLVANHTSDEHSWFLESRKDKTNDKRDFYIWKDGENGHGPNNWMSFFSGSAWKKDELTDQYYLHLFTKKQPDLNWENPKVREEVYKVMKYWLDKGIDGFRMDVISVISKRNYDDSPYENFNDTIKNTYANGPRIHDYLKEMNQEVMSKYDMMTVGEGPGISLDNGLDYVDVDRKELDMVFHFDHMFIDHGPGGKFDVVPFDFVHFKNIFAKWDNLLKDKGWGSIFLGNHDFPRIVSRFGNDGVYREQSAKLLATMLLSLRGTTYIYQGDELGMTNVAFNSIDDYRDVETINAYRQEVVENGRDINDFLKAVHYQGRDNVRTPVQWTEDSNGGFTEGDPWIKVNPNYREINVASQQEDSRSILNYYRKMIQFRKDNTTLVYGNFEMIEPDHKELFIYRRTDEEGSFLITLNFSDQPVSYQFKNADSLNVAINNYDEVSVHGDQIGLEPWQSIIFKF